MGVKEDLGMTIRTMRLSRGMTQADLAKALNQSPSSITMYETGRRMPDVETLEAMADIFNVPLSALTPSRAELTRKDADRLEALHQNPRLGLLFDRTRKMSSADVDFMIQMAERITKERDGE